MFITFEGADGSGKSTQVEYAKNYLIEQGYDVITTRDPGGTELGLKLREILLNHSGPIAPLAEMFIFLADRAQHVEQKIKPLLETDKIVLCDRYIDSTVAYQGYGRSLPVEQVNFLNDMATTKLKPDLTILFNVSTDVAMERVIRGGTQDRLESEMKEFHQKVANGYLEIAKKNPERFFIIDANLSIIEVSELVKIALNKVLTKKPSEDIGTSL
jgi:dTMP kinase